MLWSNNSNSCIILILKFIVLRAFSLQMHGKKYFLKLFLKRLLTSKNSIQDWVSATRYQLQLSAWNYAWYFMQELVKGISVSLKRSSFIFRLLFNFRIYQKSCAFFSVTLNLVDKRILTLFTFKEVVFDVTFCQCLVKSFSR